MEEAEGWREQFKGKQKPKEEQKWNDDLNLEVKYPKNIYMIKLLW